MTGEEYVQQVLAHIQESPIVTGADDFTVAWETVLKATSSQLDAPHEQLDVAGRTVFRWGSADAGTGRLFVCLGAFNLPAADDLRLGADDTLILRSDKVSDETTLTLAPRCRLVLLERVPREVSL